MMQTSFTGQNLVYGIFCKILLILSQKREIKEIIKKKQQKQQKTGLDSNIEPKSSISFTFMVHIHDNSSVVTFVY